ncbi:hypothetical protein GCM10029976_062150 [Kribbella albertanoniae]|uniref:DUF8175 domain-containing protein n=1 Tax=Kribbella albertanoniae TaxID=1266829 RepID=A0A4R4P1P0_9ACTN|nr:hypothetical protein [Kribbella albertanoniae]TDC14530.1 hypothetical protein E1261_42515 [Kribbella albertanoniae]
MGLFSRSSGSDDDGGDESTGFWQERGFVAGAVILGAVVICALLWVFTRDTTPEAQPSPTPLPTVTDPTGRPTEDPTGPPATPDPTTTSTPTPKPPVLGSGGCKTAKPPQGIPRVAPVGVTWQFESDMLFPLQQQAGPAAMDRNGVRSCFAHSPTGAVFATFVLLAQIKNPALTADVLATRVAPGPGRDAAVAQNRATPTPRDENRSGQFAGFKVIDYEPDRAIISIAVRFDERTIGALPVTMVWTGKDWKGKLQPDGSFNGSTQPDLLGSLESYVGFQGA